MVVAGGAWETPRLLLRSEIANSSGLVGRYLMYHFQTFVVGSFPFRLHGHRGRSVTHLHDDHMIVDDDVPRLRAASTASPTSGPASSSTAAAAARSSKACTPRPGIAHTREMLDSTMRDRLWAFTSRARTSRRSTNRIDLDPRVRDVHGFPAGRATYDVHPHEVVASRYYAPKLDRDHARGRRRVRRSRPPRRRSRATAPGAAGASISRHIMGTCRMGDDPRTSVVDRVAALPRRREHGVHRLVGVPDLDRLRPDAHDRRARDPRVPRARRPAAVDQHTPRLDCRSVHLDTLSDDQLADSTGAQHRLGDLWRDQPVVLVFLRHFG